MTRGLRFAILALLAAAPAASQSGRTPDWVVFDAQPAQQLADHRRINGALSRLAPQRTGVVDAYVVVVSLDNDPVFGREAREVARVLARRFDAAGRTLVLADDEGASRADAPGSPHHLTLALGRVAEIMDRDEDVLILYSTSHGRQHAGLAYQVNGRTHGMITPARLSAMLELLGIPNRLLMLQACYSGQFLPHLSTDRSIVITAADADHSSFGCTPGNDWTFFGHALVNLAMRKPLPLARQFADAARQIAEWERDGRMERSRPQMFVGKDSTTWLSRLEQRAPATATAPVGQPPSEIGSR